jgi:DNA mismatch repair ATPase MutL
MKELSLNILDIVENSTKAKAELVKIEISESNELLSITITDNGTGMDEETLKSVADPFYTTRTTRKVGMGIPLFRLAVQQTGGEFSIASTHIDVDKNNHGTEVRAVFNKTHIDFTPLGDIISTVTTLIQGHPDVDFLFSHTNGDRCVSLDTREMRQVLEDIPLDSFEVLQWIKESLAEQYDELNKK